MSLPSNLTSAVAQSLKTITAEFCASKFADFKQEVGTLYCNWTFDSILCWPPTVAGHATELKCPDQKVFDPTKYAVRKCSTEGFWEGKPGVLSTSTVGWTNYSGCYFPEFKKLLDQLGEERELKLQIAERTRILEFLGLSVSLISLIISLVIFYRFRILKNNRTKIHRNLFIAMVIQVFFRLTLYIDQEITRRKRNEVSYLKSTAGISINNTPYVCEASYVLLEYAKTAMFLWMFIEGLYLHNVVTVSVFSGRYPHITYISIGWGISAVITAIWAVITANTQTNRCWFGYNLTPYYWVIEGPRLVVICLNFIFLLNIIRVLVVKLRQSRTSDVEQVRKAVKAAVVLLPLLGITNMLSMTTSPVDRSALEFATWSYITHFLTSFQGFFIAMIYCFLNGEVRAAIAKSISVYMSLRGHHDWADRRQSFFSNNYPTAAETEQASPRQVAIDDANNSSGITQHEKGPMNMTTRNKTAASKNRNKKCYQKWINSIFTGKRGTSQIKAEPTPDVLYFTPGNKNAMSIEIKIDEQ